MDNLRSGFGIVSILLIAYLLSENRKHISIRFILSGLALQFVIAILLLKVPIVSSLFQGVAYLVNELIGKADAGIQFVFGEHLADPRGPVGSVFAIRVLPIIVFFSSLISVLYYLNVMQKIISSLAWMLRRALRITGMEATVLSANVFVGQIEAPLCIKPYIDQLTRSQLATLMVGGFATIAGTVLVAYVTFLGGYEGEDDSQRIVFLTHLLTASVMSAPAAFIAAKMIVPETETPFDLSAHSVYEIRRGHNLFDAAAIGATDGLKLAANIAAMLLAYVSLLALINWPVEKLGTLLFGDEVQLNIQTLVGWLLQPLAWLIGVSGQDASIVGRLVGEKLILTEFIAYKSLGSLIHDPSGPVLSERSIVIATYALCGFANFASIAVQIGALTSLAPTQRTTIVELGFKTMLGGALASLMTASIVGVLWTE